MSPGFKFNEWEMKGVPIRVEVGLRDLSNNEITLVRRDILQKSSVKIDGAFNIIKSMLNNIQQDMLKNASKFLKNNTYESESFNDFKAYDCIFNSLLFLVNK